LQHQCVCGTGRNGTSKLYTKFPANERMRDTFKANATVHSFRDTCQPHTTSRTEQSVSCDLALEFTAHATPSSRRHATVERLDRVRQILETILLLQKGNANYGRTYSYKEATNAFDGLVGQESRGRHVGSTEFSGSHSNIRDHFEETKRIP
jgi:hypothetical protein